MALRKQKYVGLSQPFDVSKFINFVALERYTNHLKLKVIQEKGLVQTVEFDINNTIKANKWELLCEHPNPNVVPIVREFYANGMEKENFKVFVKGKWVPFD